MSGPTFLIHRIDGAQGWYLRTGNSEKELALNAACFARNGQILVVESYFPSLIVRCHDWLGATIWKAIVELDPPREFFRGPFSSVSRDCFLFACTRKHGQAATIFLDATTGEHMVAPVTESLLDVAIKSRNEYRSAFARDGQLHIHSHSAGQSQPICVLTNAFGVGITKAGVLTESVLQLEYFDFATGKTETLGELATGEFAKSPAGDQVAWWSLHDKGIHLQVTRLGNPIESFSPLSPPGDTGLTTEPSWSNDGRYLATSYFDGETETTHVHIVDVQERTTRKRTIDGMINSWQFV